jgi:hypothetical protein
MKETKRHVTRRTWSGALLFGATALATVVVKPANATPTTYIINTHTTTEVDTVEETITGSFTVDFALSTVTGGPITFTGGAPVAGIYSIVSFDSQKSLHLQAANLAIDLNFQNDLNGGGPDPLEQVVVSGTGILDGFSDSVSGGATPTPEPSSLVLLGGAILFTGLRRRRSRRGG